MARKVVKATGSAEGVFVDVDVVMQGGGLMEDPVIEQVVKSLEVHAYCALDSTWIDKMVREGTKISDPDLRFVVENIRKKYQEAGRKGLFIVKACDLGLCRMRKEDLK